MQPGKIECPSCAMEIDGKSRVCPVCKYEFPSNQSGLKWVAIGLAILFIVFALLNLL